KYIQYEGFRPAHREHVPDALLDGQTLPAAALAAARPGKQPGPARVARLDHEIPTFEQFRTSSTITERPGNVD
ncbi:hypothetical protein ABT218_35845, partial [Streptomyces sp. NPDC001455]